MTRGSVVPAYAHPADRAVDCLDLPLTLRPMRPRLWCIANALLYAVVAFAIAAEVAPELSLCVIFVFLAVSVRAWGIAVTIGDRIEVRNLWLRQEFAWEKVRAVKYATLPPLLRFSPSCIALVVEGRRFSVPIQASGVLDNEEHRDVEMLIQAIRQAAPEHVDLRIFSHRKP